MPEHDHAYLDDESEDILDVWDGVEGANELRKEFADEVDQMDGWPNMPLEREKFARFVHVSYKLARLVETLALVEGSSPARIASAP